MCRLTTPLLVMALTLPLLTCYGQDKGYKRSLEQKRKSIRKYMGFRFFNLKRMETFEPYQYFGGGINALNYFGDLAPVNKSSSTDFSFTRPGIGLYYGYKFHQSLAVRFNYNFGMLRGDDFSADPQESPSSFSRYQRNLSFRNFIHETSANLVISILPERSGMRNRPLVNAHVALGISLFYHNPQAKAPDYDYQMGDEAPLPDGLEAGEWVNLQPLDTEGKNNVQDEDGNWIVRKGAGGAYNRFQIGIPVSLGAVTHLNQNLSIGLEFGIHFTFTDYLDDVSSNYVDLGAFEDPIARIFSDRAVEPMAVVRGQARFPQSVTPIGGANGETYRINGVVGSGVSGSIRGNPDLNDHYFITQIRVTYALGFRK